MAFGNEFFRFRIDRPHESGAVRRAIPRQLRTPCTALFTREAPMVCEFCESEIPIGLSVCPACGKPQSAPGQADRRSLWFVLVVVVMFGIAVAEHHLVFSR